MPDRKYKNHHNFISMANLNTTAIQELEDHVIFKNYQTIKNQIRQFLDSGSDLNLIKLSALKDNVMAYDQIIYQLKDITGYRLSTLSSVNLQIKIGSNTRVTEFQVIHSSFLLPHKGILGFMCWTAMSYRAVLYMHIANNGQRSPPYPQYGRSPFSLKITFTRTSCYP